MPTIMVEGPPIPEIGRKRKLEEVLIAESIDVYGIKHITVIIRGNAPLNVGANGQLIADKHRE